MSIDSQLPNDRRRDPSFVAGATLVAVTLLAIFAMAQHPTVGPRLDLEHAMQHVMQSSGVSAVVHGALIALMLVTLHCLGTFASLRGFSRPLIRAGALAYTVGVVIMIGAALVSGFVVADVVALMPRGTPADLQVDRQLLIFCSILNQACANVGAVAMSAGIALWSVDLLRDRGPGRIVGVFGCAVGVVIIVALLGRAIRLDVPGMTTVVLLQAAWYLAIAALMIRAAKTGETPPSGR